MTTRREFLQSAAAAASYSVAAASSRSAAADSDASSAARSAEPGRAPETPSANETPNIVVIFTDDQGYQDLGCFGSPNIATPRIDQMAKEGLRLTDFYVAASVCSPSRAALLTGKYPPRTGITSVLFPNNEVGLQPDETTVASLLKQKNYATACVGKWHLGHLPQFLPTARGFDEYYGIPYSNDMDAVKTENGVVFNVPLMRGEEIIERPAVQDTLTQRYTEEALRFIRNNAERPFFLYLAHTMPHIPLHASEKFLGVSKRGLYGDTIEEIDWSTGKILDELERLRIDQNTLVVFTSDNGPWLAKKERGGSALPLRGGKFSVYEGGFRVPCVMRWKNRIPAGTAADHIASSIDLLPTAAAMTGAELPSTPIDGVNILPTLLNPDTPTPERPFYFYKGKNLSAARSGEWKLHLNNPDNDKPMELYNLREDIAEANSLADQNVETAEAIAAEARRFDDALKLD